MTHSENATKLVAQFEGLSLHAYQDQGGIWTIGYGHTQGVKAGDICTTEQALIWLGGDLGVADAALARLATVPLTQNEYDALTSLVFNIGQGNFAKSTVLGQLKQGFYPEAADAILMWNKVAGVVNNGLVRRRAAERALFLTPEAV